VYKIFNTSTRSFSFSVQPSLKHEIFIFKVNYFNNESFCEALNGVELEKGLTVVISQREYYFQTLPKIILKTNTIIFLYYYFSDKDVEHNVVYKSNFVNNRTKGTNVRIKFKIVDPCSLLYSVYHSLQGFTFTLNVYCNITGQTNEQKFFFTFKIMIRQNAFVSAKLLILFYYNFFTFFTCDEHVAFYQVVTSVRTVYKGFYIANANINLHVSDFNVSYISITEVSNKHSGFSVRKYQKTIKQIYILRCNICPNRYFNLRQIYLPKSMPLKEFWNYVLYCYVRKEQSMVWVYYIFSKKYQIMNFKCHEMCHEMCEGVNWQKSLRAQVIFSNNVSPILYSTNR
jgi:hypothetical protein